MRDGEVIAPDGLSAPPDPIELLKQAVALEGQGESVTARSLMRSAAHLEPMWDEPWLRIGQSFRGECQIEEAITAYDAALARNPKRIEGLLARGMLALNRQSPSEAAGFLLRATEHAPANHQAWHGLAHAYAAMGLDEAAIAAISTAAALAPGCFRYACEFDDLTQSVGDQKKTATPDWPDGINLARAGRAARSRGALDEAIDLLAAATVLLPEEPEILKQLAALYLTTMRPEDAEPLLREAHRLDPYDDSTLNDLAVSLGRLYRFGEAAAVMDMIKLDKRISPQLLFNRATLRASVGDFEGSQRDIEAAKAATTAYSGALQSECALLPYRSGMTAAHLREAMVELGKSLPCDNAPRYRHQDFFEGDRHRPLRLGLLSNALRQHPVGWLTFAGFKALDRSAFSLHCFGHFAPDDSFAPDFSRHVAGWHDIDALNDSEAADLIAAQNIDVLFDLSGFGDGGRIGITAYRPAPVQIKWVGSQASTTGVPAIDWMITDRWETPEGYDQFYTERLLRLPDGYVCYTPPPTWSAVSPLPAIANGHVTFGCLNNLAKLTDDSLRLWARVMERLPAARLYLRCPQFSEAAVLDRFIVRAEAMGIDQRRLTLEGRAPHPAFIASYRTIDIALDPCPYSGGLTTCEAMFMGVPVITLAGDFFAARHSVSHLSNVGVTGCIATTPDEYVEKAIALAADLPALAALRADLRDQLLASPLCDAPRFGRNLGAAVRFAWDECCARHTATRPADGSAGDT